MSTFWCIDAQLGEIYPLHLSSSFPFYNSASFREFYERPKLGVCYIDFILHAVLFEQHYKQQQQQQQKQAQSVQQQHAILFIIGCVFASTNLFFGRQLQVHLS